jgi:hypothetical protein
LLSTSSATCSSWQSWLNGCGRRIDAKTIREAVEAVPAELRATIRELARYGVVPREARHIILDLGLPPDEETRLLAEANERSDRDQGNV